MTMLKYQQLTKEILKMFNNNHYELIGAATTFAQYPPQTLRSTNYYSYPLSEGVGPAAVRVRNPRGSDK